MATAGKLMPKMYSGGHGALNALKKTYLTIHDLHKLAALNKGKCLSQSCLGSHAKHEWVCKSSHSFWAIPSSVQRGHWCRECGWGERPDISKANAIAQSRGGKCLSSSYKNAHSPLQWQCESLHVWDAVFNNVKNGSWCPSCARKQQSERQCGKLEDLQDIASQRKGKCHSKAYTHLKDKYDWECEHGHRWKANGQNVLTGSWCPKCAGKKTLTLDDLYELAAAHGGKCLSQQCKGNKIKHEWQCKDGHTWWAKPNGIQQGSWCPECGWGGKPDINEAHTIAKERGGQCLSIAYTNAKTPLHWQCSFGHEWKTGLNNIKNGSWCPKCAKILQGDRQRGTLQEMQQIAHSRGGKCLATEYIDSFTKIPFQCEYGHVFYLKPNRIKQGGWCAECHVFIGESICRYYLERIFGTPFPKSRPDWLRANGKGYELDGFSESLKIAFEHHGTYHYEIDRLHAKTEDHVKKRQEKDRVKEILCAQNNIKLIVIPEIFNITPLSKLGPLVRDQCEDKGVSIPNYEPSEGMDFNQAYKYPYGNEMLAKLHKIAQNKGGECLATTWLGSETKLPFVCAQRHEFKTIPSDILGGHWCLICSGRAPIGLKTVQAFAKSHQGECLSNTYKNTSSLLKFTCKNGTIFEMTWANISKRKVFCRCGKCLTDTPPAHRYHAEKLSASKPCMT